MQAGYRLFLCCLGFEDPQLHQHAAEIVQALLGDDLALLEMEQLKGPHLEVPAGAGDAENLADLGSVHSRDERTPIACLMVDQQLVDLNRPLAKRPKELAE